METRNGIYFNLNQMVTAVLVQCGFKTTTTVLSDRASIILSLIILREVTAHAPRWLLNIIVNNSK